MLSEGDLRATEYVGSVNPSIELWGTERADEYAVKPPDGLSPKFLALLIIAQKTLPDSKVTHAVELIKGQKLNEAIDYLRENDPWIHEHLKDDDGSKNLADELAKIDEIRKKAKEVGADLSPIATRLNQLIKFYSVADQRSDTIASNTVSFAKMNSPRPVALVVGAAHTDKIVDDLAKRGFPSIVIRPRTFNSTNDVAGYTAFVNRNAGGLAGNSSNSFGFILNQAFIKDALKHRPPPTLIGNPTEERNALGSLQYITSVVASAVRSGRRVPGDIPEILKPLPGGVQVDPNSFSIDGYDVVFLINVDEKGKKQPIWIRAGTVDRKKQKPNADSKEGDEQMLAAADNEPPRDPPKEGKSTKEGGDDDGSPRKNDSLKEEKGPELLLDVAVKYVAFEEKSAAISCPHLSTQ